MGGLFLFCFLQPWESQLFCSTFPYEIVCADSWGQSLLAATDAAGVMLLDGEVNPNQYLPLSSKIKPPTHNNSILHSSERQKQQQRDEVGNDILCSFQALIRFCPTPVSIARLIAVNTHFLTP